MARIRRVRRSVRRNVRRTLEAVLLLTGLAGGVVIVGSCAGVGIGPLDTGRFSGGGAVLGAFVALILIGTVFLFTTMSRDLRLLRDRYEGDVDATPAARPTDEQPRARSTDAGS